MKRLLLILAVIVFTGVGVVVFATTVGRGSVNAPQTARDRARLKRIKRIAEQTPPDAVSRAETPETVHDFGAMNPQTVGEHAFVVRNVGQAPLSLKRGPSSCKCTLASLRGDTLLPGDETEVTLEWSTGRTELEFQQSAKILTNDPERKELTFEIRGKVMSRAFAAPANIHFPEIEPGKPAETQVFVGTQRWKSFRLEHIESDIPGLTWEIDTASPELLQEHDCPTGYSLRITSPEKIPDGWLNGTLRLSAVPDDKAEPGETLEFHVSGKMGKRIAVYGAGIDERGVVEIGVLPVGRAARVPLTIRVRDEQPQLNVKELRVQPEFVKATVKPYADASGTPKPGLFHFDIEIPDDAPLSNHLGKQCGQVVVEFDHPRIRDITVKLSFAVTPRSTE